MFGRFKPLELTSIDRVKEVAIKATRVKELKFMIQDILAHPI